MIVPDDAVDAFVTARALAGQHSPSLAQAALTDFIEEGPFARHIRRMRSLYAERQEVLRTTVAALLGSALEVPVSDTGMHVIGWLSPGIDDRALSQRAAAAGVHAAPLSAFYLESCPRRGLLLGYAAYTRREITGGVRDWRDCLTDEHGRELLQRGHEWTSRASLTPRRLRVRLLPRPPSGSAARTRRGSGPNR